MAEAAGVEEIRPVEEVEGDVGQEL
jgi:hypothetical protein